MSNSRGASANLNWRTLARSIDIPRITTLDAGSRKPKLAFPSLGLTVTLPESRKTGVLNAQKAAAARGRWPPALAQNWPLLSAISPTLAPAEASRERHAHQIQSLIPAGGEPTFFLPLVYRELEVTLFAPGALHTTTSRISTYRYPLSNCFEYRPHTSDRKSSTTRPSKATDFLFLGTQSSIHSEVPAAVEGGQ